MRIKGVWRELTNVLTDFKPLQYFFALPEIPKGICNKYEE